MKSIITKFLHKNCETSIAKLEDKISQQKTYLEIIHTQWQDYHSTSQDDLAKRINPKLFSLLDNKTIKISKPNTSDFEIRNQLERIWLESGTDKGARHGYQHFYSCIDFKNSIGKNLLEIGIGTNVVNAPSSMGDKGVPGASLLAWAKLLPEFNIHGADIEPEAIGIAKSLGFSDVYELDQTSEESWANLNSKAAGKKFSIIIDDGLHETFASIISLKNSWTLLEPSGIYVIEDVPPEHFHLWNMLWVHEYLPSQPNYYCPEEVPNQYSFDSGIVWFKKV